ncbi:hypothetical protein [Butyrivibrio sp. VCD2006]|uniref:hypothetical protein n=1 Tax=Butyrivibrio sp. VCD2006 TaxID=1280664 RepID=UPI00041F2722|nr:hypothetical protein [Butyrivibrio sp. VCD2006]
MEDKIKWHPAFYGGIALELRDYHDYLEFESEHQLSKEPLQMDMLIIKKRSDIYIDNPIANIFKEYNVIEYKSPEDSLSLREFYKTIGYACIYKGLSPSVNDVPVDSITVSLFRHIKPIKLISELTEIGASLEKHSDGIYYISGIINFPVQIVVTSELDEGHHNALRILTTDALESDVVAFLKEARELNNPGDKDNADAVLQVSASANMKLFEKIRRNQNMCEALRELMKDEIDKEIQINREEATAEAAAKTKSEIQDLYNWLLENGRVNDVKKATKDSEFYDELLEEYKTKNPI